MNFKPSYIEHIGHSKTLIVLCINSCVFFPIVLFIGASLVFFFFVFFNFILILLSAVAFGLISVSLLVFIPKTHPLHT